MKKQRLIHIIIFTGLSGVLLWGVVGLLFFPARIEETQCFLARTCEEIYEADTGEEIYKTMSYGAGYQEYNEVDGYVRDHDGDGIETVAERLQGDSDGDGIPNYLDPDDDNDGILTKYEDLNKDGKWMNDDSDGDGIVNYLDPDDDNDHILTFDEDVNHDGNRDDDVDGDGIPNYLDPDDDNDGTLTKDEDRDGDGRWSDEDRDGDSFPDYLDADDGVEDSADESDEASDDTSENSEEDDDTGDDFTGPHRCVHPFGGYPLSHGESITAYATETIAYPLDCVSEERICQWGTLGGSYAFETCRQVGNSCTGPDGLVYAHQELGTYYQYNYLVGKPADGEDICPREVRQCINGARHTVAGEEKSFVFQYRVCEVVAPELGG